ncbi:AcrR family transcriptional regulator [Amycolatopsis bartoniae]|uniref:TetR family transcriptional regulator n=1 Tax=Amycolatopsis bartoniae TaxID=941986 RepID=A0A8H9IYW5_9PSEU|nr:TetR family transcriptional regulator [Amycolatopsis bartoniae]MBB2935795.1 AcrR family transcriptional regulator [Amycolatopsis bartoniae]TVT00284.1 TetR family transcriptional regulator [Amycolatopsis bartoniae]GHF61909.1 TetR family transcriptional regulator [Amycolatopsis bartoniae]
MGLRERKKQETRRALSDAALHLAVERGLEHVLVEDIAAAANVSPRTFNNYFSSKQEAIAWRAVRHTTGAADLLRERPADEPLWEAVTNAVLAQPVEAPADGVRRILRDPALRGEFLKTYHAAERELAAAIAERTGTDVQRDMRPRLVAGAVSLAQRIALEHWLHAETPGRPGELLRQALTELREGLS